MSIETFFELHPADKYFPNQVSWERNEDKSPVRFMGDLLVQEGTKGLVEISPYFLRASAEESDEKMEELEMPFAKNSASIFLGLGLRAIEQIVLNGRVDVLQFNDRLRLAHFQTHFISPKGLEGDGTLSPEEIGLISKVAKADKTFAFFFSENGFKILPKNMQDFYVNSRNLPEIKQLILPEYEERVRILIQRTEEIRG